MPNSSEQKRYMYSGDPEYVGPPPMLYRWHAIAFLNRAEDAIAGYRQKHDSDPSPPQCVPIVHLICHAVEMLLKLALYKTGSKQRDLSALQLRHNLAALQKECEAVGVHFSADVSTMIEALSPLHVEHSLRYTVFETGGRWLPYNPEEMIELSKKLITAASPAQSC